MNFLAVAFPDIDPVAVALGPVTIKWYGLAYLTGLVLGWLYIRRLLTEPRLWANRTPPFSPDKVDDLLLYITLGVVVGGRLGFTFFYEPATYLSNPLDILAVWKGGMSFHGALVGCGLATCAFASRNRVSAWSTMDLCAAAVPLGLFFGRIANFVNAELWGRPTDVSWAIVFCNESIKGAYRGICPAGEIPRHPSQLYEAALEGLALFILLRILTHHFEALRRPGAVTGVFLIGYACARSLAELYREPHFVAGPFTAGQLYSLPMVALGLYFLWRARPAATAP
jgi:phosphatidylglycerol:prolipoprotein diacylglycerol transferase